MTKKIVSSQNKFTATRFGSYLSIQTGSLINRLPAIERGRLQVGVVFSPNLNPHLPLPQKRKKEKETADLYTRFHGGSQTLSY